MYRMNGENQISLLKPIQINEILIRKIIIGKHYREKHGQSMNDELIIQLVCSLDGKKFIPDSTTQGIDYFATDIQHRDLKNQLKVYRLVWLFEGQRLEIIGVINAFRVNKKRK
jgi:hypothetical protein